MTKVLEIPDTTKLEYKRAISQWVRSLPQSEARVPSIFVSSVGYTPMQILEEVNLETDFGREFLAGLYGLSLRLGAARGDVSIIGLIRHSS